MFNDRKAGQVAAFFLNAAGGSMEVLKLVKLIYLADRESLDRYGEPITNDWLVSMPHGPVNSQVYDCINGAAVHSEGWDEWISDRANRLVALRRGADRASLDELSDAEIEALEAVWRRFGGMSAWSLRNYTHDHCAEWRDPQGSSRPIPFADVFRALGRDADLAAELAAHIEEQRRVERLFDSL